MKLKLKSSGNKNDASHLIGPGDLGKECVQRFIDEVSEAALAECISESHISLNFCVGEKSPGTIEVMLPFRGGVVFSARLSHLIDEELEMWETIEAPLRLAEHLEQQAKKLRKWAKC